MHPVIRKTFGGLSLGYYFRNFIFGLIIPAFCVFIFWDRGGMPLNMTLMLAVNTLLYPYSRFVYESIVDFVMGNNVFVLPIGLMMLAKILMMIVCFGFAVFIAPLGLIYLYFYHTRQERLAQQEQEQA